MEVVSVMKVLIIGGMGVIGGAISEASIQAGYDVYILSRRKPFGKWLNRKATYIQGDWRNDSFARQVLEQGFQVVVDTQVFNVEQLRRSVSLCNGHCKQFVYISTDSVYEHPGESVQEDRKINLDNIRWSYGRDKRQAELELLSQGKNLVFSWTIIRPTITFGETRIPVGFTSRRGSYTMLQRMKDGKPIIRFDNPNTRHALCHVSIFGQAAVGLFLNPAATGQAYHISDNKSYTYGEIFQAIESVLGVKGKYVFLSSEAVKKLKNTVYEEMIYDKNPNFTLDNSKIKAESPQCKYEVDLKAVLAETINYLQKVKSDSTEDREYDLISDIMIMENLDSIRSKEQRQLAAAYIDTLDEEYKTKLKKFAAQRKKEYRIYVVKKALRPIKKILRKGRK